MRKLALFVLKFYLFWLAFFICFRAIFLLSLIPFPYDSALLEIFQSFVAGLKLDISASSYLFSIPFILTALKVSGLTSFSEKVFKWYSAIIIFIMTLLSLSNIIIFKFWGTLLNNRALAYLAQPKEMLASVTNLQFFFILLIVAILYWVIYKIHYRFVFKSFQIFQSSRLQGFAVLIITLPLFVIGIRGGLQLIPINESSAVYSQHHSLNQAAINPLWFLGHNLYQSGLGEENPYEFIDSNDAEKLTQILLQKSLSDTSSIFNLNNKPNVVIILLESWTADVIEPLNGVKAVTPNFTKLSKEGLLFTSIYSSGFRTDQALISVLSGFPSQPNKSIIRFPAKAAALPSLGKEFKKEGYHNSFYYGGELGFANMNNYLLNSGFSKIISIDDFPSKSLSSKWGAHDEYVLQKQLSDLNNQPQPFFSTLLTLSTHEPFDVPMQTPFEGTDESELFKKSAWYTDYCLGEYFEQVKKTPWFSNTIFILVADHGHRLPLKREYIDPRLRQIPLLIVSNLLKEEYAGTTDSTIANQHDLASTLLKNLKMNDSDFTWSVNIFDKQRSNFAYLSLDIAFTWKDNKNTLVIPLQPGMQDLGGDAEQILIAKAYLQHLYQSFTDF